MGTEWHNFSRDSANDAASLLSVSNAALAANSIDIPQTCFNDT